MKKKFLLILLLVVSTKLFAYSYTYEEFLEKSPSEKVKVWLDEFQSYSVFPHSILFNQCFDYFLYNPKIMKTEFINSLHNKSIPDSSSYSIGFDMIFTIICEYAETGVLDETELKQIASLMECKIDEYILKLKRIDVMILTCFAFFELFLTGEKTHPSEINPYLLQKKYLDAGYKDIAIDWEEIEARYHVPRKDYETY